MVVEKSTGREGGPHRPTNLTHGALNARFAHRTHTHADERNVRVRQSEGFHKPPNTQGFARLSICRDEALAMHRTLFGDRWLKLMRPCGGEGLARKKEMSERGGDVEVRIGGPTPRRLLLHSSPMSTSRPCRGVLFLFSLSRRGELGGPSPSGRARPLGGGVRHKGAVTALRRRRRGSVPGEEIRRGAPRKHFVVIGRARMTDGSRGGIRALPGLLGGSPPQSNEACGGGRVEKGRECSCAQTMLPPRCEDLRRPFSREAAAVFVK